MTTRATYTLAGIELPADLAWTDRFRWTPLAEETGHALDGTHHVELSAPAQAGRPITLQGGGDRAWLTAEDLGALYDTLTDTEGLALTLPDGTEYTVGWRHADGPIEAEEIIGSEAGGGPTYYRNVTLRLRTI